MRRKPLRLQREARLFHLLQHLLKIVRDKMRQKKAVVELSAPTSQRGAVRLVPKLRHQSAQ